jgi:hypothetical protein
VVGCEELLKEGMVDEFRTLLALLCTIILRVSFKTIAMAY